jgi:hypothetical protein
MYPAVEAYFKSLGAEGVGSAVKGKGTWFLHQRKQIKPDVFGSLRTPAGRRVIMAEGKLLGGRRFMQCVSDAEALLMYADNVYTFFPADTWRKLSGTERSANESVLRQRGLGLLLIGGKNRAELLLEPQESTRIQESFRQEALEKIWPELPVIGGVGTEIARTVRKGGWAAENLVDVIADLLKREGFKPAYIGWSGDSDGFVYWIEVAKESGVWIGVDPFGTFLEDGAPAVLVGYWLRGKERRRSQTLPRIQGPLVAYYPRMNELPTILMDPSPAQVKGLLGRMREDEEIAFFESLRVVAQSRRRFESQLGYAVRRYLAFTRGRRRGSR